MSPTTVFTILVIEYDTKTCDNFRNLLSQAGYRVFVTENSKIGLQSYIQNHPDLVIINACFSGNESAKTIEAIHNYQPDSNPAILAIAEEGDTEAINAAFEAGASDFINKPIKAEQLLQRLQFLLRNAQSVQQLKDSQTHTDFVLKISKTGYWQWDAINDEVSGSTIAFDLLGIPKQSGVTFEQFLMHVLPKDQSIMRQALVEAHNGKSNLETSFRVLLHNDKVLHIECLATVDFNAKNQIETIRGSLQDISHLHKADSLVQFQSQYDSLTSLINRARFNELLTQHLENVSTKKLNALVILDIDRFKQVNSQLGQEHADLLLQTLAQRLKRITREGDEVARLGSDEFAVLLTSLKDIDELNRFMSRFFHDISEPFLLQDLEHFISYSIGISVLPNDAKDADTAIIHANIARSVAKKDGGNQYVFFQSEMNSEAQNILQLEMDLRKAIKNNELEVYYQPQVNAKTLLPSGAEALVRWQHPTFGLISPVVFVPLAENTGLISDIGFYVLQTAIKQAERWHRQGFANLHIGINLSGRQFNNNNLIEQVQSVINQSRLPSEFIDLEITESLAMNDAEHNISILKALKSLGVSLSIDDFGTGYSSLSYLHHFPIDTLKIDRSFIENLDTKTGQSITQTIIAMANSLQLSVIAEGIETDTQQAFLQAHGCDTFQGYKYGKPMQKDAFTEWLKQYNIV